jgi:hypothetical protein
MSFDGPLFLKIPVSDMMGNEEISEDGGVYTTFMEYVV